MLATSMLTFLLNGCKCEHEWLAATCTEPITCINCHETQGEALGHNLVEATCTEAQHCSKCDIKLGEANGHIWEPATCSQAKHCTVCNEEDGDALPHTEGEWQYTTDYVKARISSKQYCTVCEKLLDDNSEKMLSLHSEGKFVISAYDYTSRFNDMLDGIDGNNYIAVSTSSDDNYVTLVSDNSGSRAGLLMYTKDGDTLYNDDRKETNSFDGVIAYADETDAFVRIFVSVIQSCDPFLSFSDAKDLASDVVGGSSKTKNGIKYTATISSGQGIIVAKIEK